MYKLAIDEWVAESIQVKITKRPGVGLIDVFLGFLKLLVEQSVPFLLRLVLFLELRLLFPFLRIEPFYHIRQGRHGYFLFLLPQNLAGLFIDLQFALTTGTDDLYFFRTHDSTRLSDKIKNEARSCSTGSYYIRIPSSPFLFGRK